MLLRIHPDNPDERRLDQAVALLERDGVIVVPTDTVYSFACVLGLRRAWNACPPSKDSFEKCPVQHRVCRFEPPV